MSVSFYSEITKLPNLITMIRYVSIPFLVYFAYVGRLLEFSLVFYLCGVSDYVDGYVARRYGQTSILGSNLDNISDELLLVLSLLFIYLLRPEVLSDNLVAFAIFLSFAIVDRSLFYVKQKGGVRLHLYSGKTFQRVFYIFLPLLFLMDSYLPFLYAIFVFGIVTFIEQSMIYIKHEEIDPDTKSYVDLKYNPFKYMYKH
ncbi:MAG TPA: CDP-alcohol phosphatidyltransferase family protein [Candidatus Methanofastidiosa archaeon]|nr:CDP-alcohol phosphatidyltransferase family protein [Candidatus Methanofastidiosa archaeon]